MDFTEEEAKNYEQFIHLLDFLLEEKNAMEYMQSEIRCEQRASVHYLSETNSTKHLIDKPSNDTVTNELSKTKKFLQKVVDGLAHISDIVCQGYQLQG